MAQRRAVTIVDVARAAGVSKGTVSFALNDRPGVSEQTRARVLAVAEQLGWTPDARARALSRARSQAVGLVIARDPALLSADPFFAPFIAGVETTLAARGWVLVLQVVREGEPEHAGYRRLAREGRVDGVLLTDLRVDDVRPRLLRDLGLPAVAVGRPRQRLPAVVLDDRAAMRQAVEHLVALGHRRVAHVAGPQRLVHGHDRRTALEDALRDHGVEPLAWREADFTAVGGAAATKALLEGRDPPTAVVYANDVMAIASLAVLQAAGLRVPDDVSVVGFDDTELGAYLAPPLTTVHADVPAWGAACAEALVDLVDDAPARTTPRATAVRELPPAQLVLRGTTAPPAR